MAALRTVVPALHSSYNEVNLHKHRLLYFFDDPASDFPGIDQVWLAYVHEHPLVKYYRQTQNGETCKISDFLDQRQFTSLGLYTDLYRHLHTRYQIAIHLSSPPSLTVSFVLNSHH